MARSAGDFSKEKTLVTPHLLFSWPPCFAFYFGYCSWTAESVSSHHWQILRSTWWNHMALSRWRKSSHEYQWIIQFVNRSFIFSFKFLSVPSMYPLLCRVSRFQRQIRDGSWPTKLIACLRDVCLWTNNCKLIGKRARIEGSTRAKNFETLSCQLSSGRGRVRVWELQRGVTLEQNLGGWGRISRQTRENERQGRHSELWILCELSGLVWKNIYRRSDTNVL